MVGLPDLPKPESDEARTAKLQRFSRLVTAALIVLCNVVLLSGLWVSGINLDELVSTPDVFNAKEDVCLRLSWERVTGAADPVRLCSEWIKLGDPSGQPHHVTKDLAVRRGPDGQYYVDPGVRSDFRLLALALFVAVVLLFGMWIRHYLVSRYRLQLDPAAPTRIGLPQSVERKERTRG
ncbi:MAG TPA: hypothetical protein VL261_02670 [Nitrospira sp.]|jgi:hypothetical protein|nr:hypothetical protein [Nitrospira sp.]